MFKYICNLYIRLKVMVGTSSAKYLEAIARREIDWINAHANLHEKTMATWRYTSLKQKSPEAHIALLQKFLAAIPYITPQDPELVSPRLWHPDFHTGNIYIENQAQISCIIDWQGAWTTSVVRRYYKREAQISSASIHLNPRMRNDYSREEPSNVQGNAASPRPNPQALRSFCRLYLGRLSLLLRGIFDLRRAVRIPIHYQQSKLTSILASGITFTPMPHVHTISQQRRYSNTTKNSGRSVNAKNSGGH